MKPVSEYTQGEHDKCPMHFQTRDCACTCGHKGERSLESRSMTFQPYTPPRKQQLVVKEEDDSKTE
jgi:hypothetical protein